MKTILLILALLFAGCENGVTGVSEIRTNIAIVTTNTGETETVEFSEMEYGIILDNGHGFAFSKNGVFVKSYLTVVICLQIVL